METKYLLLGLLWLTLLSILGVDSWRADSAHIWLGPVAVSAPAEKSDHPAVMTRLLQAVEGLRSNEKAVEVLDKCREIQRLIESSDPLIAVDALTCQGQAYVALGKREHEALEVLEEALALAERHRDRPRAADVRHNMGIVLTLLGERDLAMDKLEEALPYRLGPSKRSTTLMEMATLWELQGEFDLAMSAYRQALKINLRDRSETREAKQSKAAILDRIGSAWSEALFPLAAEKAYLSAQQLYGELRDGRNLGTVNGNLLLAQFRMCLTADAESRSRCDLETSLAATAKTLEELGSSYKYRHIALFRHAQVLHRMGDLDGATDHLVEAIDLIEAQRDGLAHSHLRAAVLSHHAKIYDELVSVLVKRHRRHPDGGFVQQALGVANRLQARGMRDRRQRTPGRAQAGGQATADLQRQLRDSEKQRLLGLRQGASYRQIADLARNQRALLHALESQRISTGSSEPAALAPANFEVPRPDTGTLILAFYLGEVSSHLFRIATDSVDVYDLPSHDVIQQKVRRGARWLALSNQPRDPGKGQEALQDLGEQLLRELAPSLDGQRLLVVLDGALELIPFDFLENPLTGRPLIEDHEITRLTSLDASVSALTRSAQTSWRFDPHTASIVIFADTFHQEVRASNDGADVFTTLPAPTRLNFSGIEADWVGQSFLPALRTTYRGPAARRDAILSGALEGFQFVHLSAHGLVNEERPELSHLILSTADAQGHPIDGRLFVHELDGLNLDCELIVLSACETALGRQIRGEGLVGMTQAVLAAGARRAVVSLWAVDDQATAELMKRFYASMARDGATPSEAIRLAKLAIRDDPRWCAPFYWAAFVLVEQ